MDLNHYNTVGLDPPPSSVAPVSLTRGDRGFAVHRSRVAGRVPLHKGLRDLIGNAILPARSALAQVGAANQRNDDLYGDIR
jgi:hypothetical protein